MPTINGLPYPNIEDVTNIPGDIKLLATSVVKKVLRTVPTESDLGAITGATLGDRTLILSTGKTAVYNGSTWTGYLTSDPTDTAWASFTLSNSWVSYDNGSTFETHAYRRVNGVVYLKGLIKNGTASAIIATLPAGFRPSQRLMFNVYADKGVARLDVEPSGVISIQGYGPNVTNAYVSLDIDFVSEQ